jgi:hypothetical protein
MSLDVAVQVRRRSVKGIRTYRIKSQEEVRYELIVKLQEQIDLLKRVNLNSSITSEQHELLNNLNIKDE